MPRSTTSSSSAAEQQKLTPEQGMRLWGDLMETTDELLRFGIQATLAPGEDSQAAYRRWHEEKSKEHDEMIFCMARRFQQSMDRNRDAS